MPKQHSERPEPANCGRRAISWVLAVSWTLGCGNPSPEFFVPPEPSADRESWGERFEVIEPGLRVDISTPYLQYHGSSAQTDSGVTVLFRDNSGDTLSSLIASHLTMDSKDKIELGGNVTMSPGDSLTIVADSLVWERSTKRLLLLGDVQVEGRIGNERGQNIVTDLEFRRWTMGQVSSRWRGTDQGEDYTVEITADSSVSQRKGESLIVEYAGVTVAFDGALVRGPSARFDGVEGTLRIHGGVSSSDSIEQLAAEELQFQLGDRAVRATAGVRLTRDDWRLEASELDKAGKREPIRALGNPAVLYHGASYLEATELEYRTDQRVFHATGAILFRTKDTELQAGKLIYGEAEQTVEASGGVTMQTPHVDGRLHSQFLSMDLHEENVRLRGEPRLVREGELLTIEAKAFRIDLQSETLIGEGEFSLTSSEISLLAKRGEISRYREGEEQAERLMVSGKVVMVQRDGVVNGDSMVVQLNDDHVGKVEVPGQVEARTGTANRQTTWIKGRGATLSLVGDRLERITLEADADVLHNDAVNDETSQISGNRMELTFAAGQLVQIDVTGDAEFASRLAPKTEAEKPSLNEVKGEKLAILLEGGKIDQVLIAKPRGSYFPGTKKGR